jgi:lipoyl-dependent peroxiredoxin
MSRGGITDIDLSLTAGRVPGLSDAAFLEIAEEAKKNCLLSRALASVNISLTVA